MVNEATRSGGAGGGPSGNRVSVRLGRFTPPRQYDQPHLEPDGGIRTKEHDVVGDVTVVQNLGDEAETFVLRGDAYEKDVETIRSMRGEEVSIRHPVFSGDVVVERVTASSTSSYDDVDGVRHWVYEYTIDLIKVS